MSTTIPGPPRLRFCALAMPVAALALSSCTDPRTAQIMTAAVSTPTLTPLAPLDPTTVPQPSARPLTEPGCCARPWWSEDGSQILFVDDPPGEEPLGVYAVSVEGGDPQLASASVSEAAFLSTNPSGSVSVIDLPDAARNARISLKGDRVAWTEGRTEPVNLDLRRRSIWVSQAQGGTPGRLLTIIGGDLIGWAGDGLALILSGRLSEGGPSGVWRVPLDGGPPLLLAPGARPRSAVLSPSAGWVAFYLAFEEDPSRDGVWFVRTSGEGGRSLSGLASYRWGREGQLLLVPYEGGVSGLSLLEIDAATGETKLLIDGSAFPGGIASNDWTVSPHGDRIVYRSAEDGSLWVVSLDGV